MGGPHPAPGPGKGGGPGEVAVHLHAARRRARFVSSEHKLDVCAHTHTHTHGCAHTHAHARALAQKAISCGSNLHLINIPTRVILQPSAGGGSLHKPIYGAEKKKRTTKFWLMQEDEAGLGRGEEAGGGREGGSRGM